MKVVQNIPNLLTLSNLMMGMIAILAVFNQEFMLAVYLTGGCLLADILDGALARKLGTDGALGVQLDSLADVISFGALPASMYYQIVSHLSGINGVNAGLAILSALIAGSAGLRLARFNVDTRPRAYFWGLATPAGGILVMALGWAILVKEDSWSSKDWLIPVLWFLPFFLAVMYQAPLKLAGLKSPKAGQWTLIGIALFTLLGLFVIGPVSLSLGIVAYVFLGVVNLMLKWY